MRKRGDYRQGWRAKRIENDLCVRCGQPSLLSHTYCEEHLRETNNRSSMWRAAHLKAGLCGRCDQLSLPSQALCKEHLEERKRHSQALRARRIEAGQCMKCSRLSLPSSVFCDRHLKKVNARRQELRVGRKGAGLCMDCGRPSLPNHAYCDRHLKEHNAHHRERRVRWIQAGRCGDCGQSRSGDAGTLCERCALDNIIRRRLLEDLRSRGASKAGRSWESLVGYTSDDLVAHVDYWKALQGLDGEMTELHHIVPLSSFSYLDADDPEFRQAWALDNLIPLVISQHDAIHRGDLSGLHPKVRQAFEMVEGD